MPMPKGKAPANGPKDSTATIGFEAAALRGIANPTGEAKMQVVSAAKDNDTNFAWVQHSTHQLALHGMADVDSVCLRSASAVLANGGVSSGQGEIRMALDPRNDFDCC